MTMLFNNFRGDQKSEPPSMGRPWEQVDEAQRYLLQIAQNKISPEAIRELSDDELKRVALNLAHSFRLLQEDFKATSAIRRAFADEHRTGAPLENYLAKLAATLVGKSPVEEPTET